MTVGFSFYSVLLPHLQAEPESDLGHYGLMMQWVG